MCQKFNAIALAVLILTVASGCGQHAVPTASTAVDPCFQHLPSGWSIDKSFILDPGQTADIARKLGVSNITQISNTTLLINGKRLQLNILQAENADAAAKLHDAIARLKGDPAFCLVNGTKVYEYVGDSSITADFVKKVSSQLGI